MALPHRGRPGVQTIATLLRPMSAANSSQSDRLIDTFSAGQCDVLERIAGGALLSELLEQIVRLVELQSTGMFCSIVLLDAETRRIRHGAVSNAPSLMAFRVVARRLEGCAKRTGDATRCR